MKMLDGRPVATINADLTASVDVTQAQSLSENFNLAFMGVTPAGPFDLPGRLARNMLSAPNASGKLNADVLRRYWNAIDITRRPRDVWIIDFGIDMGAKEAMKFEEPYDYVRTVVYPERMRSKQPEREKAKWWIYTRSRPEMRLALERLSQYIATPMVAKHRIFVWIESNVVPANLKNVIARDDDYFFGVLHSRLHEVWSLRMGTWLGVGNDPRYTPTTTFETFPFPWPPGKEDTSSPAYAAVAAAARQLHEERAAWLNPPGMGEKALKERTLTNLYNALNAWRGKETIRVKEAAGDFAPRLDALHEALDKAVCAAYGWPDSILADEEEILRRLLALNLERAGPPQPG